MKTIAHILNPVIVGTSSDLFVAQPVTFEAMRVARDFASTCVAVELLSAQFPEDRAAIPAGFQATRDLTRSALDVGSFQRQRKLPLLQDILDRMYEASDAEYFIYTNVDIVPLPSFYATVNNIIDRGYDGFVINRRSISKAYEHVADLPLMWSEMGAPHPGHDCFVFRRDVFSKYILGQVCIGAVGVGRAMLCNVACHATRFREFKDSHLTLHIGEDRAWGADAYADYGRYNIRQVMEIYSMIEQRYGPFAEDALLPAYIREFRERYGGQLRPAHPVFHEGFGRRLTARALRSRMVNLGRQVLGIR